MACQTIGQLAQLPSANCDGDEETTTTETATATLAATATTTEAPVECERRTTSEAAS